MTDDERGERSGGPGRSLTWDQLIAEQKAARDAREHAHRWHSAPTRGGDGGRER